MVEKEWQDCTDVTAMLRHLQKANLKFTPRKQRLFACACCRHIWACLEPVCRTAVETAERYADGQVKLAQLTAAHSAAARVNRVRSGKAGLLYRRGIGPDQDPIQLYWAWQATEGAARSARAVVGKTVQGAAFCMSSVEDDDTANQILAGLLRHIVGNPFRPYSAGEKWGGAVRRLAEASSKGDTSARIPLHDALLEAGHDELAAHFRENKHPRGCWALDLILGRS